MSDNEELKQGLDDTGNNTTRVFRGQDIPVGTEGSVFKRTCNPTDRERDVLALRFGLGDGTPRTLEEVAKRFTVTRERIRQIESKARRKKSCQGNGP